MTRMHARVATIGAVLILALGLSAARGAGRRFDVERPLAGDVDLRLRGAGAPTFMFKQDGEKLTGHYTGTFGEADLTGTVKGADITFSFTVDAQGNAIKETYTGTVDKDTMKGKLVIEGLGEGTFTGKKQ